MIIYIETSAVLRWVLRGPQAAEIFACLGKAERAVCSRLTLGETRRALSRAERLQEVPAPLIARARGELEVEARGWDLMVISDEVWRRAEEPFSIEPVRMLDAIHLATGRQFVEALGPVAMLSVDDRVVGNWRAMGFPLALEAGTA
jgi:predicted nucleic acid-binding protein